MNRKTTLANLVFELTLLAKKSCSLMLSLYPTGLNHMEYVHETSQMAKSYQDNVL